MTTFTLTNDNLALEFRRDNGALVGLTAIQTSWKILDRPQLGLSFRLCCRSQRRREITRSTANGRR